jgi:hypothetical protein
MQDKPLDRAERDLLAVLVALHAARGPVARDALSVEARGRGIEFGRALARLKTLALIDERLHRPFFLRRLFGARTVILLQPTAAGIAALQEATSAETAMPPVESKPAVVPQTVIATAPKVGPETGVEAAAIPLQDAVAAPEPGPAAPPVPEAPVPEVPPTESVLPPPAKPKPKRRAPVLGFTEDLGGVPMDDALVPRALTLAPDVAATLTEILSGLGMELTFAGQALAAQRMAQGATAGEALSQVVLFAFAHAVQHDLLAGLPVGAFGLADYAAEVLRELDKLRLAGEIGAAAHDADRDRILTLIQDAERRGALAAELLADPFGGAAPPAVLPDELRHGAAGEDADQ